MDQYRAGDLEGARLSLAQSYAAWPSLETLRNLAIAELNTEHVVEALRHFKTYARDKNADPAFVKTKLAAFIDRCEKRIGHVRVVSPGAARVTVDGRRVEDPGDDVEVLPGVHTVAAEIQGRVEARTLSVGPMRTIDVDFRTPAFVPPPALPTVPVATASSATPASPAGTPPAAAYAAPPDSTRSGFGTRNTVVIALSAVALASAGVGLAFGVAANGNRSEVTSLSDGRDPSFCTAPSDATYCETLRSELSAQRSNAIASDVAFGLAGAFAVGAVVSLLAWPSPAPPAAARWWVQPSVGRESGSLLVAGSF
jgi:hypothetical protein